MVVRNFYIYEPARLAPILLERADELVFVRDGFSLWAAIFPLFWMIYHRLWLAIGGFVAVIIAMRIIAHLAGLDEFAAALWMMAVSFGFGFVAGDVRRLLLERKGYRLAGAIAAPDQLEAERRFFALWPPLQKRLESEREIRARREAARAARAGSSSESGHDGGIEGAEGMA